MSPRFRPRCRPGLGPGAVPGLCAETVSVQSERVARAGSVRGPGQRARRPPGKKRGAGPQCAKGPGAQPPGVVTGPGGVDAGVLGTDWQHDSRVPKVPGEGISPDPPRRGGAGRGWGRGAQRRGPRAAGSGAQTCAARAESRPAAAAAAVLRPLLPPISPSPLDLCALRPSSPLRHPLGPAPPTLWRESLPFRSPSHLPPGCPSGHPRLSPAPAHPKPTFLSLPSRQLLSSAFSVLFANTR